MQHTFHNPIATAFALFLGWQPVAVVKETRRRKGYILEKKMAGPAPAPALANIPETAEMQDLARDAMRPDISEAVGCTSQAVGCDNEAVG